MFVGTFSAVNLASIVLLQRYQGTPADFGQKRDDLGLGIITMPLWWVSPNTWFPLLFISSTGFLGGYNLAAFNLLLEVTPDANRSVYVGVYNTMMGVPPQWDPCRICS